MTRALKEDLVNARTLQTRTRHVCAFYLSTHNCRRHARARRITANTLLYDCTTGRHTTGAHGAGMLAVRFQRSALHGPHPRPPPQHHHFFDH